MEKPKPSNTELRFRKALYLRAEDIHLDAININPILLKAGLIRNRLRISTGKPIKNHGHYQYTVKCKVCNKVQAVKIEVFAKDQHRSCCTGNIDQSSCERFSSTNVITPSAKKLKQFTALLVRTQSTRLESRDGGSLCSNCDNLRRCSDREYECGCSRVDTEMEYDLRGQCALSRANEKMVDRPYTSAEDRRAVDAQRGSVNLVTSSLIPATPHG